MKTEEKVK